jgi:voltage-gated sodium channel
MRLQVVELCTLVIFFVEVFFKVMAEPRRGMWGWFHDAWNQFDVLLLGGLVAVWIIDKTTTGTGLELSSTATQALRLLRLLRAFRILRAAKVMPELLKILATIVRSTRSVAYIFWFLMILIYMFAIIAATLFKHNDPFHFGNVGRAMVSLFRVATLEDWTDVMYFQTYGCDGWGNYAEVVEHDAAGEMTTKECVNEAFVFLSPFFFVVYVIAIVFVVLNLFVGTIVNSSMEAALEQKNKEKDAWEWAEMQALLMLEEDEDQDLRMSTMKAISASLDNEQLPDVGLKTLNPLLLSESTE